MIYIFCEREYQQMTSAAVRFTLGDFSCVVLCDGNETLTENDITSMFTKDGERMLAAFRTLHTPLGFSRN
ncbi:MAG: hypothetical protein ABI847_21835, partial [Anaerolineales bacterium]